MEPGGAISGRVQHIVSRELRRGSCPTDENRNRSWVYHRVPAGFSALREALDQYRGVVERFVSDDELLRFVNALEQFRRARL